MLCSMMMWAGSYTASNVPMVHLQDASRYVCDPDGLLNPDSVAVMDALLSELEQSTGIEVVVVAVDKIEDGDCFNFAFNIGQKYGIGKKKSDNGLVIVLSKEDRCVQFATGYGLEEFLPDAICYRIQSQQMNPYFSKGEWSKGMTAGVRHVCGVLDGSMEAEYEDEYDLSDWPPILIMFLIILIISFVVSWRNNACPYCGKHKLVQIKTRETKVSSLFIERELIYRCEHCGKQVIKKVSESRGNSSSGGYGGYHGGYHGGFGGGFGGFSGGSFGGGSFGGGGAGSRF